MIPLNEAIETGSWLQAKTDDLLFRFKPISFSKIDLAEIDNSNKMKIDGGVLWLLKIEVVNMNKVQCHPFYIRDHIAIFDSDDFLFLPVKDDHLTSDSNFAVSNGLNRFVGWSSCPALPPKIKVSGALAYLLPEEDTKYFLSVKDGEISEA
jgi:hypothetical protein